MTNLLYLISPEPWDRSEQAPSQPKCFVNQLAQPLSLFMGIHTNCTVCPASWQQLVVMLIKNRFEMTQLISACGKVATRITHVSDLR